MKLAIYNNTSFGAKYVDKTHIQKYNQEDGKYHEAEASFVMLDPYIDEDKATFHDLIRKWTDADLTYMIYDNFLKKCDARYYATTIQNEGFKNLAPEKILSVCEFTENENNGGKIEFIEGNPDIINNPYSEYKAVGTSMIKPLKNKYKKINLVSVPSEKAVNFYKRNGFKQYPDHNLKFYWEA